MSDAHRARAFEAIMRECFRSLKAYRAKDGVPKIPPLICRHIIQTAKDAVFDARHGEEIVILDPLDGDSL